MYMKSLVKKWFLERVELNINLINNNLFVDSIITSANIISSSIKKGNKLLIFGNGGSAAEAQHFSAELVGKFEKDRRALPAIALTTDTSILTAQGNDYGFERIFSRQIEALAHGGDVAIGMTTSDIGKEDRHSYDILLGFQAAKAKGAYRIGFFSEKTRFLLNYVDTAIVVPNKNTAAIQEVHLSVIHLLCHMVESRL